MDFNKTISNNAKKRKRNESISSTISTKSPRISSSTMVDTISKFEYSSDNSTGPESNITLNLESSNSAGGKSSSSVVVQPHHDFSHARILKFLKKTKASIVSDKHGLPSNSEELFQALSRYSSKVYGEEFSFFSKSSSLYRELVVQSLDDESRESLTSEEEDEKEEDEDNVPSTSTGRGKKKISKSAAYNRNSSSQCQSPSPKRKRRSSSSAAASSNALSDKDPDFGYEPPSAKRQQRVPSIYQTQPGSVASSVYLSPLEELLVQDIDTESNSSNENATDPEEYGDENGATEDDVQVPESPNSSEDSDETDTDSLTDKECQNHSCEEDCANISLEEEIISHVHSPYPAPFRRSSQQPSNGERTPGHCPLQDTANGNSKSKSEPEKAKVLPFDEYANSIYNCMTPAAENDPPRQCPLPSLAWANASDVWQTMCKKDEEATCLRDSGMLERHPGLQPRMRAILLDWLIEVCEVYKLHRETYYLAVDYLDRYLTSKLRVQKTHLQLIGITCLFVAAKVEEIYPPKIGEFAYVTDGACQEADILHNEILLLQALDWDISPVTPVGWLGVYMQLNVNNRTPKTFLPKFAARTAAAPTAAKGASEKENKPQTEKKLDFANDNVDNAFIYPQFSGFEFAQTAQLLDLCSLDVGVAHFPYSVLAAAAMSHTFNKETALRCSGLDWQTIQPCARWMEPFFTVISLESEHLYIPEQNEQVSNKFGLGHICSNISTDDSHTIQTHSITMGMFDRVTQMQEQLIAMAKSIKPEASPATGLICPDGLLTPPASSRKPLDMLDEDQAKSVTKSATAAPKTAPAAPTTTTAATTKTKHILGNNIVQSKKSVTTTGTGKKATLVPINSSKKT